MKKNIRVRVANKNKSDVQVINTVVFDLSRAYEFFKVHNNPVGSRCAIYNREVVVDTVVYGIELTNRVTRHGNLSDKDAVVGFFHLEYSFPFATRDVVELIYNFLKQVVKCERVGDYAIKAYIPFNRYFEIVPPSYIIALIQQDNRARVLADLFCLDGKVFATLFGLLWNKYMKTKDFSEETANKSNNKLISKLEGNKLTVYLPTSEAVENVPFYWFFNIFDDNSFNVLVFNETLSMFANGQSMVLHNRGVNVPRNCYYCPQVTEHVQKHILKYGL